MKISIESAKLLGALSVAARVWATRTVMPILSNVLLEAEPRDGKLKVSATDGSVAVTLWVDADVQEGGATTVPGETLFSLVKLLPSTERAGLSSNPKNEVLTLSGPQFKANVRGLSAEDFPEIPLPPEGVAGRAVFQSGQLAKWTRQLLISVCKDGSHPLWTSVRIALDGERVLSLAAVDGYRLSYIHLADGSATESVPVPATLLRELERVSDEWAEDTPVKMYVDDKASRVTFIGPRVVWTGMQMAGEFPHVEGFLFKDFQTRVTVARKAFTNVVTAAGVFARDTANSIQFTIAPDALTVASKQTERGDNCGTLSARVDGDPLEIAFNGEHVKDFLSVAAGEDVHIGLNGLGSPGVFSDAEDAQFVFVTTPMAAT